MKIQSVTQEQQDRFFEYSKRWEDIGLCTDPANRPEAERGVRLAYETAGLEAPKKIVWCSSPVEQMMVHDLMRDLEEEIQCSTHSQQKCFRKEIKRWRRDIGVRTESMNCAGAMGGIRLAGAEAGMETLGKIMECSYPAVQEHARDLSAILEQAEMDDLIGASVVAPVVASVVASVKAVVKVFEERLLSRDPFRHTYGAMAVRSFILDAAWDTVEKSLSSCAYGQHDAPLLGYYDGLREVWGLKKQTRKLAGLCLIAKNAGWWMPYEKICWISERHNVLHRDARGWFHCEDGPALAYPDGWGIYALHGVRMKKEHVMTPAERIDPQDILKEANVEVRRELIRKVGAERMIQILPHKMHDEQKYPALNTEYSLLEITKGDLQAQKFLKMLNPSIGVWHVEAVDPACKTVRDAIHSRKPKAMRDIPVDDVHGEDYQQQGDVVMWPEDAVSLKMMPSALT